MGQWGGHQRGAGNGGALAESSTHWSVRAYRLRRRLVAGGDPAQSDVGGESREARHLLDGVTADEHRHLSRALVLDPNTLPQVRAGAGHAGRIIARGRSADGDAVGS